MGGSDLFGFRNDHLFMHNNSRPTRITGITIAHVNSAPTGRSLNAILWQHGIDPRLHQPNVLVFLI